MKKTDFLKKLQAALRALPKRETEECFNFYAEMIDDRMEDGLTEEEAVAAVGSIEKIAAEKLGEELSENSKNKNGKRKLGALEITLIIIGSPFWIAIAAVGLAVTVAVYASIWSALVSLWAAFASFSVCAPAGVILFPLLLLNGNALAAIFMLCAGICCFGLAIYGFFACLWLTKSVVILSKKGFLLVKKFIVKREA